MAVIDDKVVAMSFENQKFESGVGKTIHTLDRLKAALTFGGGASKGLESINTSAKNVDLSHIGQGVDAISSKLSALRLAAVAVFAQIAAKAMAAGSSMIKALTIGPISAGLKEYSTNLNAIQTILANTQAAGTTLKDVNAALKQLNEYSDKTIYNFSQMAKNIGTFTAAGVDLKTATGAIKGIANLAALSGSNAEQASTAMYQLSQAISAGSLKLQDWNSVVNAGMGGTVFQRALAQTAETMGTLKKGAVQLKGPMKNVTIAGEAFRQSLSTPGKASWLTSDVLTTTLKQFTGDLKDADLAAMGFNATQIKAIQQTAKTAMFAATEVKTIQQAFEVAKETAGSGWAETFKILMGDFGEAKKTFTELSNAVNGFINVNSEARNKVLGDWKALGGRTILIKGIKDIFKSLGSVIGSIKGAFRDIFPAKTGKDLFDLTVRFAAFAKSLKPSKETLENLRRTFRGFFAILKIVTSVVGGLFSVLTSLFGEANKGSGSFLGITASIGDFLVKIEEFLVKSGRMARFFKGLGAVLRAPIQLLGAIGEAINGLFSGFEDNRFSDDMAGMTKSMTPFQKAIQVVSSAFDKLLNGIGQLGEIFRPLLDSYIEMVASIGPLMGEAAKNMNFEAILQVIRTGLFAAIFLMFKNFLGKGSFLNQLLGLTGQGGGILAGITGSFNALQGSMVAMQQNIKAKTLKEIAIAIALLTLSVVALSFVDSEKLKSSLTAMAFAFAQLLGAMAILDKITSTAGFIKMPILAASMILLAGAINLLTLSVLALSLLSWEQLAKGLGGVAFLLTAISAAAVPLSANAPGMIRAGIGITAIATGLLILATAVAILGRMKLKDLAKGLGAIVIALDIMIAATKAMPASKAMFLSAAGLIAMAFGLEIIAGVVATFGLMEFETIYKGLVSIGAALLIIGAAMHIMPKGKPMLLASAGLLVLAIALQGIARAVEQMGGMTAGEIARGLITLAAALFIMTDAMYAMQGAVLGAVTLGIMAGAMALLAPVLVVLGKQSWGQILKGLVGLAAALAVLGIAAAILSPAIPAMLGLGVALVLIGGGLALAGAGIALIGVGLSAIAVAGPLSVGILITALTDLAAAIPRIAKDTMLGLLEVVEAFADIAPKFMASLVKILLVAMDALIAIMPKIEAVIISVIDLILGVLASQQEPIIAAGFKLLVDLLKGIKDNIRLIVDICIDIITEFIGGIADNIREIIKSGTKFIEAFLKGIIGGFSGIVNAGFNLVAKLLAGIGNNVKKVMTAGLGIILKFLQGISNGISYIVKAGTDIIVKFINGVGSAGPRIITAATNTIIKFINALGSNGVKLANAGMEAITKFLNGIAKAIEDNDQDIRQAGIRIGKAIVFGMIGGITAMAPDLKNKIMGIINKLPGAVKKFLGIDSPSKVFAKIGESIIQGLAVGMVDSTAATDAAVAMSNGVITAVEDVFEITSPSKRMHRIGKDVTGGFALGIKKGTEEDIQAAFEFMKIRFAEEIANIKQQILDAKKKRTEILKGKGKETAEEKKQIAALTASIKKNKIVLDELIASKDIFNTQTKKNIDSLLKEAEKYTVLQEKIEKIKDVIQDFKDQYSDLPDIIKTGENDKALTGAEQLKAYTDALTKQVAAIKKYNTTLQALKAAGLDDTTYEMLLAEGTSGQEFAEALLAGGPPAIASINALDGDLAGASGALGENAAANLYNAGIKAAEGLVAGLEAQLPAIMAVIAGIANGMVEAIRRPLRLHSPSKVFEEIGIFTIEGLAKGISDSSKLVTDAVDATGRDALTAMNNSLSDISDLVTDQLDVNPTITPILDLTQVEEEARRLAALTAADTLAASVSLGQASAISTDQSALEAEKLAVAGSTVKFEQNNYSPAALTEVEIYRQTRNQLSQLKTALSLT